MTCVDTPPPGFPGPTDPACAAAPQVGTFQPVLEWNRGTWTTAPTSDQVLMSPIVASLDGDAVPDVAFITYIFGDHYGPGVLRAMSGDGQKELLNVEGQDVCGHSGLAAGDVDGDGQSYYPADEESAAYFTRSGGGSFRARHASEPGAP
jgi:hypothetical protein